MPKKTMLPKQRIEEYRLPNGKFTTRRIVGAIIATADEILAAVRRHAVAPIPDSYWQATADHESRGAVNERDTETNGFVSYGVFQVSAEEAHSAHVEGDLLTLDANAAVMVFLAERNRDALRAVLKLAPGAPDPRDMAAYLCVAHNQGLGAAKKTVLLHGMDWAAYVRRNQEKLPGICQYGTDALPPATTTPEAHPALLPAFLKAIGLVRFALEHGDSIKTWPATELHDLGEALHRGDLPVDGFMKEVGLAFKQWAPSIGKNVTVEDIAQDRLTPATS